MNRDIERCMDGHALYGDDFSEQEILEWHRDEAEGYSDLGAKSRESYSYAYHSLNWQHGFRFIADMKFEHALGLGSAYGDEFRPMTHAIERITILDPSDAFANHTEINGTPCSYSKPNPLGDLPFPDESFDLLVCLGVLHHIPNVSLVVSECFRCLKRGGRMLLREPILAMGDWRKPRPGLTKRERGIPADILGQIVRRAGFEVLREQYCNFPLIPILAKKAGIACPYNHGILTVLDSLSSQALAWNVVYRRTTVLRKLAPASRFYVLSRGA